MSDKVDNEVIATFLREAIDDDVNDFGYLLIPNDARLNDEALSNLKAKFRKFLVDNDYEI